MTEIYIRSTPYTGPVRGVIFDWAGTMVDYGCMAPLAVFLEIFKKRGIVVSEAEAREPMGLKKWDHTAALIRLPNISAQWEASYNRKPSVEDIDELYAEFEDTLLSLLQDYATPVPGARELVDFLRREGIKIGSTTGYTGPMMDVVAKKAAEQGYAPDHLVTSTDVPAGRPYPWMCYANAMALELYPLESMIKVGDTIADIQEGLNAGMWSVGVLFGGSEVGFSLEEYQRASEEERAARKTAAARRFHEAGAHYVIDTIADVPVIIDAVNEKLAKGETPLTGREA